MDAFRRVGPPVQRAVPDPAAARTAARTRPPRRAVLVPVDLVVTMSRHHRRSRINHGALLALALLLILVLGGIWAVAQAHNDCLAGRLPGPWC
jgi:hypothetical protein